MPCSRCSYSATAPFWRPMPLSGLSTPLANMLRRPTPWPCIRTVPSQHGQVAQHQLDGILALARIRYRAGRVLARRQQEMRDGAAAPLRMPQRDRHAGAEPGADTLFRSADVLAGHQEQIAGLGDASHALALDCCHVMMVAGGRGVAMTGACQLPQ